LLHLEVGKIPTGEKFPSTLTDIINSKGLSIKFKIGGFRHEKHSRKQIKAKTVLH
jgi:hypothetical protein